MINESEDHYVLSNPHEVFLKNNFSNNPIFFSRTCFSMDGFTNQAKMVLSNQVNIAFCDL